MGESTFCILMLGKSCGNTPKEGSWSCRFLCPKYNIVGSYLSSIHCPVAPWLLLGCFCSDLFLFAFPLWFTVKKNFWSSVWQASTSRTWERLLIKLVESTSYPVNFLWYLRDNFFKLSVGFIGYCWFMYAFFLFIELMVVSQNPFFIQSNETLFPLIS